MFLFWKIHLYLLSFHVHVKYVMLSQSFFFISGVSQEVNSWDAIISSKSNRRCRSKTPGNLMTEENFSNTRPEYLSEDSNLWSYDHCLGCWSPVTITYVEVAWLCYTLKELLQWQNRSSLLDLDVVSLRMTKEGPVSKAQVRKIANSVCMAF